MLRNYIIKSLVLVFFLSGMISCQPENKNFQQEATNPEFLHRSLYRLTEVIMHDIFNPPVASRIYAYSTIAAYEALIPGNTEYMSLSGQLHGLDSVPQPEAGKEYCYPLACVKALLMTGKALIFSEEKIEEFEKQIYGEFKALNMPDDVYDRSLAYGEAVAKRVIAWSKKDNYAQTRSFPKYTITNDPSKWRPTPPDYSDALEPHWRDIRTMVMDSASQFAPPRPTKFDTLKTSQFYQEAFAVYKAVKDSTAEHVAIARYWDDNPFATVHEGHVMIANKKITPGGHWLNITRNACEQKKLDFYQSADVYARVSIGLFEAFISCWDEKFRSNVIRPESYINQYIDPDWRPILQTPPFPEYTSGHSVASGATSFTLTSVIGDKIPVIDSTEIIFGMAPRSFPSFNEAAQELAMSRFYGGIHYMPAVNLGIDQGKAVGKLIQEKIKTKK